MKHLKKIVLISIFTAFLILAIGNFTFAQRELEVEYPEVEGVRPEATTFGLPNYVKYIFNFSLGLAGLVVFIVLVYAGFRYFTSGGDPAKMGDARNQIFAAFLGLIILLSSYLILTTINPQLVFLRVPERVHFPQEPLIGPKVREKETLFYAEFPVGGLIEELFSKARLKKLKETSEELRGKAEELKDLAEELETLTNGCSCLNCDMGDCEEGNCSGNCDCISNCHCLGDPYSENDPCLNREAINQKREEITAALREEKDFEGIKYWQKELDVLINGSEGGEEKIIGLKQVYEDLLLAEESIKKCPRTISKKGEAQILLGYNEFWQYRERLEKNNEIKGVESEYPFDYISPDNSYYLANFYCAEVFYEISTEPINIEEIEIPLGLEEGGGTFCESEILIGETVDNAEELARRMLVELDNINNNTLSQIEAAEILSDLPEECQCGNCVSSMSTSDTCCEEYCCECCPPPEEEEEEEPPWWEEEWWRWERERFWRIKPLVIYAQDGCEYGCCEECCEYYCCTSCRCVCSGHPCPREINTLAARIQNNYSEIENSNKNYNNLIEEKEVEDRLKISEIFKNLDFAQNQLGPCYTSSEIQRKVLSGEEKVLWRSLYSCSRLKESLGLQNFYDENGQPIAECYGPNQGESNLFDNFFCCYYEIFW